MRPVSRTLGLALLALFLAPCAGRQKKSAPPPPRCMRLDRVQGTTVEVTCSGHDSDSDGLDDAADLCPEHAETANGVDDSDGCPDPDTDGDYLTDEIDDCPHDPGPEPTGCPIQDSDGDGFADHLDSCPLDPEDLNGVDDADGCPDGADVVVVARNDTIYVKQPVHFLARSAMLLPDSKDLLDRVAASLKRHRSRIARIRVVGHCDRREVPRRKAGRLSRTRARVVARYLVLNGFDKKLFEIESLGSKKPASRGRRKRDREKNQRAELLVTLLPAPAQPDLVAPRSTDAGTFARDAAAAEPPRSVDAGSALPITDAATEPPAVDASAARPDAATSAPKSPEPGVESYDDDEDWDSEFIDDDWDQKILDAARGSGAAPAP